MIFEALDKIFGVFFKLSSNEQINYMLGIFIIAFLVSILINVITAYTMDIKKMRNMKEKLKKIQEQMKDAHKNKNTKKIQKLQMEMMNIQKEIFRQSFKPMLISFLPIVAILSWLKWKIPKNISIVELPFNLPIFGNDLGWFGWYIFVSIVSSMIVKKIMKLEY